VWKGLLEEEAVDIGAEFVGGMVASTQLTGAQSPGDEGASIAGRGSSTWSSLAPLTERVRRTILFFSFFVSGPGQTYATIGARALGVARTLGRHGDIHWQAAAYRRRG